jgi:hypothetical protein
MPHRRFLLGSLAYPLSSDVSDVARMDYGRYGRINSNEKGNVRREVVFLCTLNVFSFPASFCKTKTTARYRTLPSFFRIFSAKQKLRYATVHCLHFSESFDAVLILLAYLFFNHTPHHRAGTTWTCYQAGRRYTSHRRFERLVGLVVGKRYKLQNRWKPV